MHFCRWDSGCADGYRRRARMDAGGKFGRWMQVAASNLGISDSGLDLVLDRGTAAVSIQTHLTRTTPS